MFAKKKIATSVPQMPDNMSCGFDDRACVFTGADVSMSVTHSVRRIASGVFFYDAEVGSKLTAQDLW